MARSLHRYFGCSLLLAGALLLHGVCAAGARADFGPQQPSAEARQIADWAIDSTDHKALPFVIVDKKAARVFVFDGNGQLVGADTALLGLARGDDSAPGIGTRAMSTIRPEERTTPAGRFEASMERSLHGEEILWVDYDAAIALHRVITTVPRERRLQRLASQVPAERRITYGCINVPVRFFEQVVIPAFKGGKGIVYVLPDARSVQAVFGLRDADAGAGADATLTPASAVPTR